MDMTNITVIRDGLVSISWTTFLYGPGSKVVIIDDPKTIFKSCRLYCKLETSELTFRMNTKNTPDSFKAAVAWVSYCSVKRVMKLFGSAWTPNVGWDWDHSSGECITFQIVIDFKPDGAVSMEKIPKYVPENLEKLWQTKNMSDITFKCGDELIKGHTLILASGSPVLEAMFQHDFKERQEKMVLVKDIEAKVFENLLHYLYVGNCDMLESEEENDVVDLLVAAEKYDVESLKMKCGLYLSNTLTIENASQYLVLAHLHNSPELNQAALKFIARNAKAICSRDDWMEMMENFPKLCFRAVKLIAKC